MSITKLPSGRYRCQVYDPLTQRNISVATVIGGPRTFASKREAKAAREQARSRLTVGKRSDITVAQWRERWLTDPLFAPPKQATLLHNAERTKRFTAEYGHLKLTAIDDEIVADWLAEGNASSARYLRTMFNAAASRKAGRLVTTNPFTGLGISHGKGNAEKDPPPENTVWDLITAARQSGPYWAAWLQVAAFTGMRPGELDALRWENVDFEAGRIRVVEQFSVKSQSFTLPKNSRKRAALLTPQARGALAQLPRTRSPFCFVNTQGNHFTHKARTGLWNRTRRHVGYEDTLYLATRHFFGSYAVNVLELDSEDVAFLLGHEDGGKLVRELYGHRDRERALDRAMQAITASSEGLRAVGR